MKSCIYEGRVRHRRFSPTENEFDYRMFMVWLDLAELPRVFRGRWLWSTDRFSLAWFRRKDHLGDPDLPLDRAVRDLVEKETGRRPRGPIRLLTNLRYWGYVMNPVSFYYCFDPADRRVEAIVADVSNTPWGERHAYVLDRRESETDGDRLRFRFGKEFHVSPFMGMDQSYDWRFGRPGPQLTVHMENHENGARLLDATLVLRRREITGPRLAATLAKHPFMTLKVIAGIYWQAFRLWWKGTPFHPHPKKREKTLEGVK